MVMRNNDSQWSERWVDAGSIEIPPIRRQGFESSVLQRDLWEHEPAPEEPAEEPAQPPAAEPEKQRIPRLLRMDSPEAETIVVTEGRVTIGKSRSADRTIGGNPAISRIHAVIYRDGSDWFLEDQGSLNHTYVDGRMIDGPCRLQDHSIIRFADEDFLLTMQEVTESEIPGI